MKTIKETAMELLLDGEHLDKGEFHDKYHTFTLTQRIEEIRRLDKWDVMSKTIPGRKGMVEYWLEPEEIARIKAMQQTQAEAIKNAHEEKMAQIKASIEESKKLAEMASESLKSEDNAYFEQMGLGLLGGHNYRG